MTPVDVHLQGLDCLVSLGTERAVLRVLAIVLFQVGLEEEIRKSTGQIKVAIKANKTLTFREGAPMKDLSQC